jgi:hypothetical protein
MVTKMSLAYPNARLSDVEATERMQLYAELLRDIPFDILSSAFRRVVQTNRFFPTVAEIREAAAPGLAARRGTIVGLRLLLHKHDREWSPPIPENDRVKPGDTARILAEVSEEIRRKRGDPESAAAV